MKLINLLFVLMIVLADIAIYGIEATLSLQKELEKYDHQHLDHQVYSSSYNYNPITPNVGGNNRFDFFRRPTLARRRLTCNKFPRVCRAKGSPGPSCCKKKCVDLLTDRRNCGKCGQKCKYNNICCNGKCVNPSFHKSHCGGCNNGCGNGGLCAFGLCSYS